MTPTVRRPIRLRSSIRLVSAATLLGLVATLTVGLASASETPPEPVPPVAPVPEVVPDRDTARIVQANIKTGMAVKKFSADVAAVMAGAPDFITFNEVHHRSDDLIVPPGSGYAMWRDTANRYRSANVVAWREDSWTVLDRGTRMLSNWRGVPKGKKVELGRRFANWVTLRSNEGRVVSVVSAHLAPLTKGMPDLRRRGTKRLGALVEDLAVQGPVLVGGDFNFHYRGAAYPADLLAQAQLEPTYATLGSMFPTGKKFGFTIDFVFTRGVGKLMPTSHHPIVLNSDHAAVVADLEWIADAPVTTVRITNNPKGTLAQRRAAARELRRTIAQTTSGSRVEVFAADLRHAGVFKALRAANARGVRVTYLTRTKKLTKREKRLSTNFAKGRTGSKLTRCGKPCRKKWRQSGAAQGTLLITPAGLTQPTLRVDVNRRLNANMVRQRTSVVRHTGGVAITEAARLMPRRG